MTLPASIRVNVGAPFPARVSGSGPVVVSKANGIWTISFSFTQLAAAPVLTPTQELLVYDPVTGIYATINAVDLVSLASNIQRDVEGGGSVSVLATDSVLLVTTTAGGATSILLPAASTRSAPITVKDLVGNANSENITFVPNGTDTIDGFSGSAAAANGVALIDQNYGKKTLSPLASGTGWFI